MREVLVICLGQCGTQIGSKFWERLLREHTHLANKERLCDDTFFKSTKDDELVPRTVFIDLDPEPINTILKNKRHLKIKSTVTGKESAANSYSRGMYLQSGDLHEECIDTIRQEVEQCSNLASIVFIHSCSGGTGGGYISSLIQNLQFEIPKCTRVFASVLPSPDISNCMIEPYNFAGFLYHTHESIDMMVCYNNQALYQELARQTDEHSVNYEDINEVIASSLSTLTLGSRELHAPGSGSVSVSGPCSLVSLKMNLTPYPQIKYLSPSISHLVRREEMLSSPHLEQSQIVNTLSNFGLFSCFSSNPKYQSTMKMSKDLNLTSCLIQRGNNTLNESFHLSSLLQSIPANHVINKKKPLLKLLNYNTASLPLYTGSSLQDTLGLHESYSYFQTSSEFGHYLSLMALKFKRIYHTRAFVHWLVGCGLESGEMSCSAENLYSIMKTYETVFDINYSPPEYDLTNRYRGGYW